MAVRRPFWKWHRWKSIGFCLWPPSTCIWNLKLKFQSKLDLCSQNHVVYRQTDGRTDGQTEGQGESSIPPSNFVGRGYNKLVDSRSSCGQHTLAYQLKESYGCQYLVDLYWVVTEVSTGQRSWLWKNIILGIFCTVIDFTSWCLCIQSVDIILNILSS